MNMRVLAKTKPRAASAPPVCSKLLQRKCACGGTPGPSGECEECQKKGLQRKLTIGASNDPLEAEADQVAAQVMDRQAYPRLGNIPTRIQRVTGQPAGQTDAAPLSVDETVASPGRPLDATLRQDMEQRFGYDFSRVRVHSDVAAEQSAQDVNAHAYTVGHDIVFGAGQFAPETSAGRGLIAHELTHVVQQNVGGVPRAVARQPADTSQLEQKTPPKASKCYTGCAQRWGQDTTCSKWGYRIGEREHAPQYVFAGGKGKKLKDLFIPCCNTWPWSLEDYARRNLALNGAGSCPVQHEKEIATITYGEKSVDVLCSDTIPTAMVGETKSASACSGKIKTEVIEMSPKAMQDLSGQVANALHVSVCYSGSKEDLCLHNGPGKASFPDVGDCLTDGCTAEPDTPKLKDTGWPRS